MNKVHRALIAWILPFLLSLLFLINSDLNFVSHSNYNWPPQVWMQFTSVQFSRSVLSDSLQPHEPQASLSIINSQSPPKPMSSELVMPSNHLTLCRPFFSCPQSFPASGSFQMSQLFTSGSRSIGVSASTSVLPVNTQDWSPLAWTGWCSSSPPVCRACIPSPPVDAWNHTCYQTLHVCMLSHFSCIWLFVTL